MQFSKTLVRHLFLALLFISGALTLDLQSVEDGACTSATPDPNFNQTWFETAPLTYFPAGSKHHLYTMVWGWPNFSKLREFEFYYYACTTGPVHFSTNTATVRAFGGFPVAEAYDFHFPSPGVLRLYQKQLPRNIETLNLLEWITLTDNKTYVFIHICVTNWNLKTWMVFATVPSLDAGTQQKIQEHAVSLGHSLDDIIFYRYDSCNKGFPLLQPAEGDVGPGWKS